MTNNVAGEDSLYIQSQSPNDGWFRGKLNQIANTTDVDKDILDHTIKRSDDIWHSNNILKSINDKYIYEIPKTFGDIQDWFLTNEADRCYDRITMRAISPQEVD